MKKTLLPGNAHGMSRRAFLAAAAGAAAFSVTPRFVRNAFASQQPMIGKPLTLGVARTGSVAVIPLFDAPCSFPLNIFKGADEADMLKAAGVQPIPGAVNVFLIERGRERFLVDTGFGAFAPNAASQLPQCLEEAKVPPQEVSKVFITHMHLDHIGGLVSDGKPAYPYAEVYIARAEYDYWMGDAAMPPTQESMRGQIRDIMRVLEENQQKITFFKLGDVLSPDVQSVDLSGHTPGHSGIRLKCKANTVFFVGDLAHGAALQMPRPDITIDFDADPARAKKRRQDIFDDLGKNDLIAGAHFPFPGLGFVHSEGWGSDAYKFVELGAA